AQEQRSDAVFEVGGRLHGPEETRVDRDGLVVLLLIFVEGGQGVGTLDARRGPLHDAEQNVLGLLEAPEPYVDLAEQQREGRIKRLGPGEGAQKRARFLEP